MIADHQSAKQILSRCADLDFALAGICRAEPTSYEQELRDWLAAGRHGEMQYLSRNLDLRLDPRNLVPGAKSMIVVADRYSPAAAANPRAAATGTIARYARGDDYHVIMKRRLHTLCNELAALYPAEVFRACVDTAPVLEREHAQRAGLGAIGKNTLLLQRGVGSYLLLGEIITTLRLQPSPPADPDPCGTCTRCIDACPTAAITPWSVDATRCISYLTIEHRGVIDSQFHRPIGDWIFGCDVCQEVCPHNQTTARTRQAEIHPAYHPRRDQFDLLEVLNWNEDARRAAFIRSSMKRAKLNMMKRNALIVAGNRLSAASPDDQDAMTIKRRIVQLSRDPAEDELVRTTALQVLQSLESAGQLEFVPSK